MPTVTDNLDVAREALVLTDDISTQEVPLKNASISVKDHQDGSFATMAVEGEDTRLSEFALRQLSGEMGIPTAYLLKCPAALQAANLEYWQKKLSDRKRVRVVVGQEQIQAITSPNFIPIKNVKLFDAAVEKIADMLGGLDKLRLDHFEHDWDLTRMAFTHENASHTVDNIYFKDANPEAHVNDIVRAGVNVVNSLINEMHTEIQPFAFRLICANRMVTPVLNGGNSKYPFYRYDNGGGQTGADWLAGAIDEIGKQFEPIFKQMDEAARKKLVSAEDVLRANMANVPGHMREAVMEAYLEEPTPTVWGVTNAITRASRQSQSASPRHRLAVERYAGQVTTDPTICEKCGLPADRH